MTQDTRNANDELFRIADSVSGCIIRCYTRNEREQETCSLTPRMLAPNLLSDAVLCSACMLCFALLCFALLFTLAIFSRPLLNRYAHNAMHSDALS
jgi:hypothetical protein